MVRRDARKATTCPVVGVCRSSRSTSCSKRSSISCARSSERNICSWPRLQKRIWRSLPAVAMKVASWERARAKMSEAWPLSVVMSSYESQSQSLSSRSEERAQEMEERFEQDVERDDLQTPTTGQVVALRASRRTIESIKSTERLMEILDEVASETVDGSVPL